MPLGTARLSALVVVGILARGTHAQELPTVALQANTIPIGHDVIHVGEELCVGLSLRPGKLPLPAGLDLRELASHASVYLVADSDFGKLDLVMLPDPAWLDVLEQAARSHAASPLLTVSVTPPALDEESARKGGAPPSFVTARACLDDVAGLEPGEYRVVAFVRDTRSDSTMRLKWGGAASVDASIRYRAVQTRFDQARVAMKKYEKATADGRWADALEAARSLAADRASVESESRLAHVLVRTEAWDEAALHYTQATSLLESAGPGAPILHGTTTSFDERLARLRRLLATCRAHVESIAEAR